MNDFLHFIRATMVEPEAFGTVHLIAIAAVVLLVTLLCIFFRDSNPKIYARILLIIWAVMLVMDILRQVFLAYSFDEEGNIVWKYAWGAAPLQLCDAPLYLLPAIALLKEGKLKDALSAFMYSYVLLGGLVTLIAISSIASTYVFLTFQTLLHHGLQIVACIFIAVHERKRVSPRKFLSGALVFLCAVVAVTAFNLVMHELHPEQAVNMYFISPYQKKVSPVFNDAWMKITGIWQILFYVGGVSAFAFILFMILYGIFRLSKRLGERKSPNTVRA